MAFCVAFVVSKNNFFSCRNNKPGKTDDWFCRRCNKQKSEAGEWKPPEDQAAMVEVIPAREANQSFRTLAQKKEYDAPLEQRSTKKKGRPSQAGKKQQRTPSKTPSRTPTPDQGPRPKARESWVTGGSGIVQRPSLPPGVSVQMATAPEGPSLPRGLPAGLVVGRVSAPATTEPQPLQEKLASLGGITLTPSRSVEREDSPAPPSLPPGISISGGPSRVDSPKLPPGISLGPERVTPSLPTGLSVLAPNAREDSPAPPSLPPGISISGGPPREVASPKLPPGISMGPEQVTRLPAGISVGVSHEPAARSQESGSEEEGRGRSPRRAKAAISYQEPPLNKKMRQGDNAFSPLMLSRKTEAEPSLTRPNLPPGLMISTSGEVRSRSSTPQGLPSRASTPMDKPDSPGMVDHDQESSDENTQVSQQNLDLEKKQIPLKKKKGKSSMIGHEKYEELKEVEESIHPSPEPVRKKKGRSPKQKKSKPVSEPQVEPEPEPVLDADAETEAEPEGVPEHEPEAEVAPEPDPEREPERKSARGRSELARAKIRATLREDSLSDEEFGGRVPYRGSGGPRWKSIPVATKQATKQESQVSVLRLNREAWKALGAASPTQHTENKSHKLNETNGQSEDEKDTTETLVIEPRSSMEGKSDNSDNSDNDDGVETFVIEPKGKKRGRKAKSHNKPKHREPTPEDLVLRLSSEAEDTEHAPPDELLGEAEDIAVAEKPSPKGRKRKNINKRTSTDSEDAPLSQRKPGRRRSGRSDGAPETPSPLPPSPVRNKPTAVVEPVRTEIDEVSS